MKESLTVPKQLVDNLIVASYSYLDTMSDVTFIAWNATDMTGLLKRSDYLVLATVVWLRDSTLMKYIANAIYWRYLFMRFITAL